MSDVGNLTAKLTLDTAGFEKNINGVGDMTKKLASGVGSALGSVTTAIGAAVAAAAAGVVKLTQSAVKSYADYEQLVGGVETLFKQSAGIIEDYAMQSYKTAGISANEYMSTVTSFSASLIQSLGGNTEQAAQMANMAIIDMSDNANKMGSSMESIQNAYQGFAKQNYTMLDNLKLGYGGTQQEMYRLLQDAAKIDEQFARTADFSMDSKNHLVADFADIVQAIHIVQNEMGITGTTAQEAEHTISGSWNMVKASFQDLLTSLAGGGKSLSDAIDSLVGSAEAFITNIVPVVEEALYGIGDLVMQLAPIIAERLPELLGTLVPKFTEAAVFIVNSLIQTLPSLIATLGQAINGIIPSLTSAVISALLVLLTSVLPTIAQSAVQLVMSLARGLLDNADMIISATLDLVFGIIDTIILNFPEFLEIGFKIVLKIVEGILMAIPRFLESIGKLIGIVDDSAVEVEQKTLDVTTSVTDASDKIIFSLDDTSVAVTDFSDNFAKNMDQNMTVVEDFSDEVSESTRKVTQVWNSKHEEMIKTSEGFRKATVLTGEVVKEAEVKVYDANGNIVDRFNTTYETIGTKSVMMSNTSRSAESTVGTSMSNITSSSQSAAAAVESSVARMNASLNSLSSGNLMIGARASGGPVQAGVPYMTGEEGRELFVPASNGYIMDNDDTEDFLDSYGSGGIHITIQGDVYDDERSLTRKLSNAVRNVIESELAYAI